MPDSAEFPYRWVLLAVHPERRGQHCRIVGLSRWLLSHNATVIVEFEDGFRTTSSRLAIKRRDRPAWNGQVK